MNPSSTAPQPITLPSQNPNPNPKLTPNSADPSSILSSLKALISLSHQTLQNSNVLPPKPQHDNFLPCPYNPHHLVPPEYLFRHTLNCPSPLEVETPHYQNTLQSLTLLHHQNINFTIQDSNQELYFSLDDYITSPGFSSLFYRDCPGVVCLSDVDSTSSKRTFTLPGFLSIECANVHGCIDGEVEKKIEVFDGVGLRILGSDLWFLRREVEGWTDYEYLNMYSFNIICAILGLRMVKESDLSKWIIVNSPRFGIVIDVYVTDHIFVLVGLCLKAVIREALGFMESVKGRELEGNLKSMSFKCPVLSQALMWLASQLSVLYGQMNAKIFAINIFKQCILESASRLFLFPFEQNLTPSSDLKEGDQSSHANQSEVKDFKDETPLERIAGSETSEMARESVNDKVIFVSQVATAVAALHERSLLEGKIRGLRVSQPLTSYQRMVEHAYVSNRADEERKKRPNYRPIIEHDGLPKKRPSNQETSKHKTKEELLAEERDYKRRRMSYRGKKLKRTTLEVMRDIIEEYMEEIKQAGGIGCFVKGDEEEGMFSARPPAQDLNTNHGKGNRDSYEATRDQEPSRRGLNEHHEKHDIEDSPRSIERRRSDDRSRERNIHRRKRGDGLTTEVDRHRKRNSSSIEGTGSSPMNYSKQSQYDHDRRYTAFKDALPRDVELSRLGLQGHHEKHGEEDPYSRSMTRYRSDDWSHDRREQEDVDFSTTKHYDVKKTSSSRSSYHDNGSSHSSSSHRRNIHNYDKSESVAQNMFEDRYDPESRYKNKDDVFNGSNYIIPE